MQALQYALIDVATRPAHWQSSETNEWYTPAQYIDAARQAMGGIDLDPAGNAMAQQIVGAASYFTKDDDGLRREWFGNVWLNPPYGKTGNRSNVDIWAEKLRREYQSGRVQQGILLCNTRHSELTGVQHLLAHRDALFCLTDHRIQFYDVDGNVQTSPPANNLFVYVGRRAAHFAACFVAYGLIARRWQP